MIDAGPVSRYVSGRGIRCFCSACGSPLWFESRESSDILALPMGIFDEGDLPRPAMHIWTGSKPAWCEILDDLPRHETDPPV
jgi:hypothetical protein